MSTIVYPNAVAPASERRTLSIAFVVGLHLLVIYTIMVALNIVPSPLPTGGVQWITPKPVVEHPPIKPLPPVTMTKPGTEVIVPPDFDITPDNAGDNSHKITGQSGTQNGTGDVFGAPGAVAGTHTIPSYPALDKRLGHEGTVSLLITLDAQGQIGDASVTQSSGFEGLDAAAVAWVKEHWRYKPATRNGTAVPSTVHAQVVFHLT